MVPVFNSAILSLLIGGYNISNENSTLEDSLRVKVVTKCELKFDTRISYCGTFDSLQYGVVHYADRNQPEYISRENCESLKRNRFFYFEGRKLEMMRSTYASFDVILKGEANSYGGCRGASFKYEGKQFYRHVMEKNIRVSVTEETYFVFKDMLLIPFMKIPISNKWFLGNDFTLIW